MPVRARSFRIVHHRHRSPRDERPRPPQEVGVLWPSRRDLCGESDPQGGKGCPDPCPPLPSSVPHQRPKGGVALTTSIPPVRRAVAPCDGEDPRGAASLRFPASDAGNPCCHASSAPFRESPPTTTARAPPSERKALWVSQSCHPSMSPPPSEWVTPIRRHLRDPQRRKPSIIPGPSVDADSSTTWSTLSMTASQPP